MGQTAWNWGFQVTKAGENNLVLHAMCALISGEFHQVQNLHSKMSSWHLFELFGIDGIVFFLYFDVSTSASK